jgi:hypothetical protein
MLIVKHIERISNIKDKINVIHGKKAEPREKKSI